MEEVNRFLDIRESTKSLFSSALSLCIFSPTILLILLGLNEGEIIKINEEAIVSIGVICILLFVSIAVFIFIRISRDLDNFKFLEDENIETEYGVSGIVREKKESFKNKHNFNISLGVVLCILSAVPLMFALIFEKNHEYLSIIGSALLLLMVGIGV